MALGGYKFVGYKYARPADYDSSVDAQVLAETLKMHKCKLKAFTESCAASGAQWDFSYSAGDYAFGTHGNVIYKLDSSGFNLVSFFRYGEEDAYYAIVTLSDASWTTGYSLQLNNRYYYYSGTTQWSTQVTNDMSCLGLVDLNMDNINVRPGVDRLALFSDNAGDTTSASSELTVSKIIPEQRYYGYVTKSKRVISIFSNNMNTSVKMKVSAIDALSLSSPSDTKNIFSYAFSATRLTGTSIAVDQQNGTIQTLRQSGTIYESIASYNTSYNIDLFIQPPKSAIVFNPTNNIPFEQAVLCASSKGTARNAAQNLNIDGILAKGQAPIDLLAVNIIVPYNGITPWHPYANGNYLSGWYYAYSGGTSITALLGRFVYIGWDPSNPDITQESAWTAYTE